MVMSLLALVAMSLHVTLLPLINTHDLAQALAVALVLLLPFLVMALTEIYLARVFRS
jgi:hypothetical protein